MRFFFKGLWKLLQRFGKEFVRLVKATRVDGRRKRTLSRRLMTTHAILRRYTEVTWVSESTSRLLEIIASETAVRFITPSNLGDGVAIRVMEDGTVRVGHWGRGHGNSWFTEVTREKASEILQRFRNANSWIVFYGFACELRMLPKTINCVKARIFELMEQ